MIEYRQKLALRAALLTNIDAVSAWSELRSQTSIEDLDHSVTRILPSVYRNIKANLKDADLPKLKGSTLHTWAKNIEFLRQLEPLVVELTKEAIDYRVLKGGAINLLFNPPNFRIMGDIDLLISKSNFEKTLSVLQRTGFAPKYAIACQHFSRFRISLESSFVNQKSLEIDLHVVEARSEAVLFGRMLKLSPCIVIRDNLKIRIPQTESLIIHAIRHGLLAVEPEDLAQMVLDVELLTKKVDLNNLIREMRRLNMVASFHEYLALREEILGATNEPIRKVNNFLPKLSVNPMKIFRRPLILLITLMKAILYRAPRLKDWNQIWRKLDQNRILYLFWLYTGLIRQFELLMTTRFRGFLPQNYPDLKLSPVSIWANDWRFRVSSEKQARLEINLESQAFEKQSFLVFSNGKLVAVTEKNALGKYQLLIRNPSKFNEISIRLPFAGCKECAKQLSDLTISNI